MVRHPSRSSSVLAAVVAAVAVAGVAGCETVGRACDSACGSFFESLTDSCGGASSNTDDQGPSEGVVNESAAPAQQRALGVAY